MKLAGELICPSSHPMAPFESEAIMTVLRNDIAAYDRNRADLEAHHHGEWAVFHGGDFIGLYPEFEQAAEDALERFGEGPYRNDFQAGSCERPKRGLKRERAARALPICSPSWDRPSGSISG
jgi:hypothetical protein